MKGSFTEREKYEQRFLKQSNILLRTTFNDPRLQFVTFTKVELVKEYQLAKIYWDTFDVSKKEGIESSLKNLAGKFRSSLSSHLKVRHTPQIHFVYDSQYEDEHTLMNILNEEAASRA